eukprot:TRINITY_DN7128_c0_g1_i1.p1 TRINITY_DN7128_c0_g1~~TRINITY_DN7128_c0_g1_i1.p1  ORF type:complete len:152 (-),score=24.35 TRINITY_DN7128_c0_g1_i1:51-506(-)
MSFTLAILKPDTYRKTAKIWPTLVNKLNKNGLEIASTRKISNWERSEVEKFYGEHRGKFFYGRLVHSMSDAPIQVVVLKNKDDTDARPAFKRWRDIIGPTHLRTARSTSPDSLRARYAFSDTKNSFHGSDSEDTARKEIKFFFRDFFPEGL